MLKRFFPRKALCLLAAISAVMVSAASGAQATGEPEKATVKVGIIPISNLTPLYVAQKRGFFKDAGLTVETTIAAGGPALTGALIGGSLDFVYTSYVSVFQAQSQGFDLVIVANQNSAQFTPPDAASLIVKGDGDIQTPSDLVGKRIGISALTNINHITALNYLSKHGIGGDKVKFVEVPFPNMGDMLARDQIDAAFLVEPFTTILAQRTKVKPLAYPFVDAAPGLDIAGFVTSRKFLMQNPITVEHFVAALARANAYLNKDSDARVTLVAEYTKSKPEIIRQLTLDRWMHTVNVKDLQLLSDLGYKYGFQKKPVKVVNLVHKTALE